MSHPAPLHERLIGVHPDKRSGKPEEQAATIAFLASDNASFIIGQVINYSGGQS